MKNLLIIAALALSTVSAFAETYTVSIGINDYPTAKDEKGNDVDNDLSGCVNDAKAMKSIFTQKFGVKEANTRLLLDKNATAENFLDNVKWLIATAKAGDQVVFSYSGHGGQIEDPDSGEADGLTEVIVLADGTLVQDDLFNEISTLFTINGINCTFVFDSCFSGGMSRDTNGKIKVTNKSLGVIEQKKSKLLANIAKTPSLANALRSAKPKQVAGQKKGDSLFLYASKENKTSSDISGIEGIEAHGLFTLLFMEIIEDDKDIVVKDIYEMMDATLSDINASLREQGKKEGLEEDKIMQFDQGPNFEASAARAAKPIILSN
jgi:hypothetical protein